MQDIDIRIKNIDNAMCEIIDLLDFTSRGLVSQNLLGQSRHLIEHIAMKAYSQEYELNVGYSGITDSLEYIKRDNKYQFLRKFHAFLQESKSHYTPDNEGAERLVLKYYEFYVILKHFVKKEYKLDILYNLERFPVNLDKTIQEYYEKIVESLDVHRPIVDFSREQRFYIQKVKSFNVNNKVYYENSLIPVNDSVSKFDRFVAFSKIMLPTHYAIKAAIFGDEIQIENKRMPINILSDFIVSIRPCELNNYAKYFGEHVKNSSNSAEYKGIMNYLTRSGVSFVEILYASELEYLSIKTEILSHAKVVHFMDVLDKSRELIHDNRKGSNIIKYLIHTLRNKILKDQYSREPKEKLSDLYLEWGCIPFDEMPFASSPIGHIPRMKDVFGCIDSTGRECELLAKYIQVNTSSKAKLYTKMEEVEHLGEVDNLIEKYNDQLYFKHPGRKIEKCGRNLYIKEFLLDTEIVIKKLLESTEKGIIGYKESVLSWLEISPELVNSEEKRILMEKMFDTSRVAMIYGAAGTGKTYLINHLSQFFDDKSKLYLANTNPAVENLRRKVISQNCNFLTIKKFITRTREETKYDILIIDECSMVSNSDMKKVLEKAKYKILILVGDIYQIESITFGNWFSMAKYFLPASACCELETPYRAQNENLLKLWKKVRNLEADVTEHIVHFRYASLLNETIFEKKSEDEIILCLNYNGIYGINNINRFLQNNNKKHAVKWGIWKYVVGDPILFNESGRFAPTLYNNLKGKIVGIEVEEDKIWFSIEIEKVINELDIEEIDINLLEPINSGKSIVKFYVEKNEDTDDENDSDITTVVPFQIAYAVSIHKAQGLEYDSVKVVITEEIDKMITHNIFYTAITRAKNKLKIYWSPESQQKIISNFVKINAKNDAVIFAAQTKIKLVKNRRNN